VIESGGLAGFPPAFMVRCESDWKETVLLFVRQFSQFHLQFEEFASSFLFGLSALNAGGREGKGDDEPEQTLPIPGTTLNS